MDIAAMELHCEKLNALARDYRQLERMEIKWSVNPSTGAGSMLFQVVFKHDVEYAQRLLISCAELRKLKCGSQLEFVGTYAFLEVSVAYPESNCPSYHMRDFEEDFFIVHCTRLDYMEYSI